MPLQGSRPDAKSGAAVETTLTRQEFYKLAHECRDYAARLANNDQDRVSRDLHREFNEFLRRVQSYDRLEQPLSRLRPARGLNRTQVLVIVIAFWLAGTVFARQLLGSLGFLFVLSSGTMLALGVFLLPPATFGTTVEQMEGRLLVVVQALQRILETGEMDFTEAAYFVVRDVLREAAAELRQQVYLARHSA